MSEKMRELQEAERNAAGDVYFSVRPQINTTDRCDVFDAGFDRGWQAALRTHENGGQESEAGAVEEGTLISIDISTCDDDADSRIFARVRETMTEVGGSDETVILASPETALLLTYPNGTKEVIYRAADSFELRECKIEALKPALVASALTSAQAIEAAAITKCVELAGWDGNVHQSKLLELIPQDGRTALEEFGMKIAKTANNGVRQTEDELRDIVTNLIGVPPLNSETVSGEK